MARLKKEYKEKYKKKLGWDEKLIRFAFKAVGSAVLLFTIAIGLDVYQFLY
ncbi:MAG: hypothetical protein PHH40_04450 [Candidatus Moranbacteria bacterium]|nr:hypothetical protein [Candidatus Moranbacteria bacterium]MDD3964513.1 hypothetical protein [Candidatus Moranbacteria bacterium]